MQEQFHAPDPLRFGATKVLEWLWLAGEEDLDEPLNEVHLWLDLRNDTLWNRKVRKPEHVIYVSMPFKDGDLAQAEKVLPIAKAVLNQVKDTGQTAVVNCHAGVSRSALLALWCMAEEIGYEAAWCKLKTLRPHVEIHENFYPIMNSIKQTTKG